LIKLDKERRRAGHNSIACIDLKKPSYTNITTQTDSNKPLEPSKPPTIQDSRTDSHSPIDPPNPLESSVELPLKLARVL